MAVVLVPLFLWHHRRTRREDSSGPTPWRDGHYYRLTAEEKKRVRRAIRNGEAFTDPRLAEAAWRQAELARYGNLRRSRAAVTFNIALQACVIGSLLPGVPWLPLWAALLPPVLLFPLGWLGMRGSERAEEAAHRAATVNRVVVEQAAFRTAEAGNDRYEDAPPGTGTG